MLAARMRGMLIYWIATPLTWLAMTKEDCHATDVARNESEYVKTSDSAV